MYMYMFVYIHTTGVQYTGIDIVQAVVAENSHALQNVYICMRIYICICIRMNIYTQKECNIQVSTLCRQLLLGTHVLCKMCIYVCVFI